MNHNYLEARNRPLNLWLTRVKTRQLVLPRFQRYEAWSYSQIESLLNTVLNELPVGAVLTLDVDGENEPFLSRPIAGAPDTGDKISEHLLDGQQRLTAFWKSLNDLYEDRLFLIKVSESDEAGQEQYAMSIARYEKNNVKYPIWANSPQELWSRRLIPVPLLRPDQEAEKELGEWKKAASGGDAIDINEYERISRICTELRVRFSSFNIPFLSLPIETKPDVALGKLWAIGA